jgi:hypothetical protein
MSQLSLFSITRERQYYDVQACHQRLQTWCDGGQMWIHYYYAEELAGGGDDVPGALFVVSFDYRSGLYRFTHRGHECFLDAAGFGQWHNAVMAYSAHAPTASALVAFGEERLTYEPRRYDMR